MTAVATVTTYAQKALSGVAVLLSVVALVLWAYHLLGPTTPTSMAHALTWTFLAVLGHGTTYVIDRIGGA